jgi:hypothetical protein
MIEYIYNNITSRHRDTKKYIVSAHFIIIARMENTWCIKNYVINRFGVFRNIIIIGITHLCKDICLINLFPPTQYILYVTRPDNAHQNCSLLLLLLSDKTSSIAMVRLESQSLSYRSSTI